MVKFLYLGKYYHGEAAYLGIRIPCVLAPKVL
jgi:hypothetical protein